MGDWRDENCELIHIYNLRNMFWATSHPPSGPLWGRKEDFVTWTIQVTVSAVAWLRTFDTSAENQTAAMESISNQSDFWPFSESWQNTSVVNGTTGLNQTNPLKRNEEVAKVEVTVLALVLFLALAGNLCVLVAIHTTKHNQSRMYYFMKHLSIADLVVAIFQALPQLIWDITFRFYGPDMLCRLVKYLQVVGMFASTYMLVLMSVDRCLAICQPLRSLHRRKDRFYVVSSWVLSMLLSIPQMFIFSLKEVGSAGSGVYDCWGDFVMPWGQKAYITWISLTIYIIPVAILSICYGLISFKIWQNFRLKTRREHCISLTPKTSKSNTLARVSSVKLISKAKITTVKMTFVIVVAYIVCWTPFFSVQMWSAWDPAAPREGRLDSELWLKCYRRCAKALVPIMYEHIWLKLTLGSLCTAFSMKCFRLEMFGVGTWQLVAVRVRPALLSLRTAMRGSSCSWCKLRQRQTYYELFSLFMFCLRENHCFI